MVCDLRVELRTCPLSAAVEIHPLVEVREVHTLHDRGATPAWSRSVKLDMLLLE